MGLCYTFNANPDNILSSTETGNLPLSIGEVIMIRSYLLCCVINKLPLLREYKTVALRIIIFIQLLYVCDIQTEKVLLAKQLNCNVI